MSNQPRGTCDERQAWRELDRTRVRGIELVSVNPMLVVRGREEGGFTFDLFERNPPTDGFGPVGTVC